MREILRSAGLRATPSRLVVLELLQGEGRPLSHGEIQAHTSGVLDRVTLYRTLTSLSEAGLVHAVQGTDGAWRYGAHPDPAGGCPGGHPHFLCVACGAMSCLTGQSLPWVEVPEDHSVIGKQLVVHGHCPTCGSRRREAG